MFRFLSVIIPHVTVGVDIRNRCLWVYCEIVTTKLLIQMKHLRIEAKIEYTVEQSLDPFGITGLFMDDSIDFGAVFRMSLARKPLYI